MEYFIVILFLIVIYLFVRVEILRKDLKNQSPVSSEIDDKGNTLIKNSKGETILIL